MRPEERRRAGLAIRGRLAELGLTVEEFAGKAGLDPTTVRATISGRRWPREQTRAKLCEALGWEDGEIARRAVNGTALRDASLEELVEEMCNRVGFYPWRELPARHAERG